MEKNLEKNVFFRKNPYFYHIDRFPTFIYDSK